MKEILNKILSEIGAIRATQDDHGNILKGHTEILDNHTKTLDKHTTILDNHTRILDNHAKMLGGLKLSVAGIMDESRQIHSALIDNKEIRNKEIENLKVDVAEMTGVIKGIRNSVQNYKKAE